MAQVATEVYRERLSREIVQVATEVYRERLSRRWHK